MMRPIPLTVMAATAVILVGCANRPSGVQSVGGDVFVLQTSNLSGSRAVENGLAEAAAFCEEYGRQFVLTDSRVGSGSYQLQFRCLTGRNLPPIAQVAAAPPPPAPVRGRRARSSGTAAYAGETVVTEAPRTTTRMRRPVVAEQPQPGTLAYGAALPPMVAPAPAFAPGFAPVYAAPAYAPSAFAPSAFAPQAFVPQTTNPFAPARTAGGPPPLPPVATTPLFAPPPGVMLPATPVSGPRLPPIDNSPLVAVAREPNEAPMRMTAAPVQPQPVAPVQQQALPPVESLPLLQSQAPAAVPVAQPLPPIQAPAPGQATPLYAPPASFTTMVPSAQPLPGAASSLPPIAGSSRAVPLPGNTAGSAYSSSPPGFWTGGR